MTTMRYGDENLASFPDNVSQLIVPENVRDLVVSNRSGGVQVIETTDFTVPITAGVPVSVNPLLPGPQVGGVLWSADGNNRAYPNYDVAIPGLVIPEGHKRFANVVYSMSVDKAGSGTDSYLFQIDNDGTPLGTGVTVDMTSIAQAVTFTANVVVDVSSLSKALIGLFVTGIGTGDDLNVRAFEQMIIDQQMWTDPDA